MDLLTLPTFARLNSLNSFAKGSHCEDEIRRYNVSEIDCKNPSRNDRHLRQVRDFAMDFGVCDDR